MGFNTIDVNDYITLLSKLTKVERKEVYVIVMRNFMAINQGLLTVSDAYCNISNELKYDDKLNEEKKEENNNNRILFA